MTEPVPPPAEVPAPRALPAVLRAALESDEALVMVVGAYGTAIAPADPQYGSHANVDIGGSVIRVPALAGTIGAAGTPAYVVATKDQILALGTVGAPAGGVPIGGIIPYGGSVAPTGYLVCDGASYATSAYPALFAAIAYTYGGSGANFNVPDLQRRAAYGAGGGSALGASDGRAVGSRGATHHHSFSDSFSVSGSTDGVGDHSHGVGAQLDNVYSSGDAQRTLPSITPSGAFPTTGAGGHSHGFSASGSVSGDTSGGGGADSPGFLYLNQIIRAL